MPRWLDSTLLMLRWQFLRFRAFLPMLVVIQLFLAVGVIYGLAFLVPDIDTQTAVYLATGAPTLSLILLGLNVVPQEVAQGKIEGRYAYLSALPMPRLAPLAAEVTFWLLVQLPGTVLALVVAVLRFDVGLDVGWSVGPAIALVALTGASVGYALAAALPPKLTAQVMAFMGIVILLFSPINFPAERLPGALQAVHRVLPVQHMADVVRGSLTGEWSGSALASFAIVAAWCAAGLLVSYRAAVRRP
jgi:ABC-2 type transport system permease protein